MRRIIRNVIAGFVAPMFLLAPLALAQITVTVRVVDPSGSVVVGARVDLIGETQGARTAAVITNATGDYVVPNLAPDTYTLEIGAPSFMIMRRTGIVITGCDRAGVPLLTLEVGATTEQVTVEAQAALVRTQSAERSTAIESKQIDELPISHANFTNVALLTPGVQNGGNSAGGTWLSGQSQNNIMMDGVSAMDTGNNGQMLSMNIESIGEVKVLTQGRQAEYGRSNGLQIATYIKSGANTLHGSGYGLFTRWNWNKNSRANWESNVPQVKTYSSIYGYSLGGPVFLPKVFNGNKASRSYILGPRKCKFGSPDPRRSGEEKA